MCSVEASEEPLYDPRECYGILPPTPRQPYDMREIIARLVDGSRFHEFKPLYGTTLVCGFARLEGYPVGILANNGVLFSDSSLKGTHFIELATSGAFRLLFLQNIGIHGRRCRPRAPALPRTRQDGHGGRQYKVPRFTLIIGGSFGAGNYGMCGRAYTQGCFSRCQAPHLGDGREQAAGVLLT